MEIEGYNMPDDLYYDENHFWIKDDADLLVMGLDDFREQVFEVLMDLVPDDVDPDNGRSGMGLWKILVLGTLRLSCNWDYDKLLDIKKDFEIAGKAAQRPPVHP